MKASFILFVFTTTIAFGCTEGSLNNGDASNSNTNSKMDSGDRSSGPLVDSGTRQEVRGFPKANAWSWDGSWAPLPSDFPIPCIVDSEYGDGHNVAGTPSPILPPGVWDYQDGDNDLANWRNFRANIGQFDALKDSGNHQYGWRLIGSTANIDFAGAAAYFKGSCGADVFELGSQGKIHSIGEGGLGDGPDVLVFRQSYSLDYRTGSSKTGSSRDNDLVVAGCGANPDGSWDVSTTTIHTGPGKDWVFVRDIDRAAIDAGNGDGGRTDTVDQNDGNDLVVLRGNTHDFRVYGGGGHDTVVWYVNDNIQTPHWLGPNFFGGGGFGDGIWSDGGTDRLVLAIAPSTKLVTSTPTPPSGLLTKATDGALVFDSPTQSDVFGRYCVECGKGPGGRKTVIFEYVSSDSKINTGYFYVTAFEEIQIGIGEGARVYRIDDVHGTISPLSNAELTVPPDWPTNRCE